MIKTQLFGFTSLLSSRLLVALVTILLITPVSAFDKLPEVSSDGLHLQKDSKAKVVYLKAGATISQYSKIKILDCFVDFEKNWQKDYNMNELGLDGRIRDKDAERIKQELAAEFKKVFTEELTKQGHQVVDDIGADVLLLRPALINVDVMAPDLNTAGMSRSYVRSAGDITLYMELYDSATNTLLGRIIDPQSDNRGGAMSANKVTNKAAADRILRSWAALLAKNLSETKQVTNEK